MSALSNVQRALALDDRQEVAHLTFGVLLAIAGKPEDGMAAAERALALNTNNPQCHHAKSMICLYQGSPDGEVMMHSARTALALSPTDSRATMYRFFSGFGESVANGYRPTKYAISELEEACRHLNAPWFAFMICAVFLVRDESADRAVKYLEEALGRYPELTLERYRTWFLFPIWPEWVKEDGEALDVLVSVGLPKE